VCIIFHENPSQSCWGVACYMGLRSVTCHPTEVNLPRLNPSQTSWDRYSIYLPRSNGRL